MSDNASFRYTDPGTYYPQATCGGYTATAAAPVVVDPALPAPANVTATATSDTAVTVAWNAVTGADSYVVTYWPTADPTDTTTVEATALTVDVTGLTPATQYGFSVHAIDANGAAGTESATATATTEGAQLPTPTGLTVGTITATGATATWTAVAGAENYLVSWALQSAPTVPVGSQSVTTVNHAITGLTADTDYVVSVVARATGIGDSDPATANFSTIPQLATPTGLATSNITATGADVAWTAVAGADGYEISWALTASPEVPLGSDTDPASPYSITGLTASTGYTVSVTATDSTGASADSAPGTTTFTTTA
jgi:hypothetical protein